MADTPDVVPIAQMFVGQGVAQATPTIRLVAVQTGAVIERCPVDAREILAAGEYLTETDYAAQRSTVEPRAEKLKGGTKG